MPTVRPACTIAPGARIGASISHVLGGEYVSLEEIEDGLWDVYFGRLNLGRLDERDLRIEDALGRKSRRTCRLGLLRELRER